MAFVLNHRLSFDLRCWIGTGELAGSIAEDGGQSSAGLHVPVPPVRVAAPQPGMFGE